MFDENASNVTNWNSLISLYEFITASDNRFKRISEPFIAYQSEYFDWPNFVIIDKVDDDFDSKVTALSRLMASNKIPQLVLCHPDISQNDNVTAVLESHGLRQVDQWINICYDLSWGLPKDLKLPDFRVEKVIHDKQADIWADIASRVFHHGQPVPVRSMQNEKFLLLVGYIKDIPIATIMAYWDKETVTTYYGAVLKEYRGKGYGQQILRVMFEYIRESKYDVTLSQSTLAGIKSWEQAGYHKTGYIDIFRKIG